MRLHLFKDGSGVLAGANPHAVISDVAGTLYIGSERIEIAACNQIRIPTLRDGVFASTFVTNGGVHYNLGQVNVRIGTVVPSKRFTDEEIRLKHRVDELETKLAFALEEIDRLDKKFDTDSLNFIFKGE